MEVATIDGCSKWMAHRKVTIPMMKETFKFCLIIAITSGIGAFVQMLIMTNGGPGTSNYTLTFMIYRYAFLKATTAMPVRYRLCLSFCRFWPPLLSTRHLTEMKHKAVRRKGKGTL